MDEISKLSKAGERMLEKIFRSGDGKENEPYERRNPAQVRGQDMGNSFGQSKGLREDCEATLFRGELIRELREEDHSVSELSRRYELSCKTIHS